MKMNNFYVYEWIRLDTNEPFYVGKGQGDRAYSLKDRNKYFHNIVNKVGLENCAVVILHNNLTENEALEIECWYIHQYKYLGPYNITNLTDGGEGIAGYKHTEETKKKISNNHGTKNPEVRRKISNSNSGKNNPMYGRTGEKHPMYGRTGEKNPMWGKKHTEGTKRKMSEAKSRENNPMWGKGKAIILIFPDGSKKEFGTIKDASLYLGGVARNCPTAKAIQKLLNGWIPKRGRWVGYSAMCLEDYEKLNKDKLIS